MNASAIKSLSSLHPKPSSVTFQYGTAGFRMKSGLLDSVMFRVGILAALRSKKLNGKTIGVMVTASHNPEEDNGVKLVDPYGEMLEQSWETYATRLANAATDDDLVQEVEKIVKECSVDLGKPANVVVGRDTRPSGTALVASLIDGLKSLNATYKDHGIKTTPQLHFITRCLNDPSYGEPSEEGYYKKLAEAYKELVKGANPITVTVDCANGVGAPKLEELVKYIGGDSIKVNIANANVSAPGTLNHNCGADFVKVNVKKPEGVTLVPGQIYASLDGDADRIVFYYVDQSNKFYLLDGDKISQLAAEYIIEQVRAAGLKVTENGATRDFKVGVVQTAYANGESTRYLTQVLGIPVSCASTGVKHLHHEAEKSFDVGVYFEANGHGTVLFNQTALKSIFDSSAPSSEALSSLRALANVINQTVGDALSDMLFVLAILVKKRIDLPTWDKAYTDLPSRLVKVVVKNRGLFKAINADRELQEPRAIQEMIWEEMKKVKRGRSFVRPSGTEDVVRVYAEAESREECDRLAYRVAGIVFDNGGGVGAKPKEFL
ncbi:phosphoacetylglucosamine mutase [Paraphysoderma sedebokerense]|nr:phosphoacetylglucosamine mutase [Paraphysoderma sedebokerense]